MNCPICKKESNFLVVKKDRFGQNYEYQICKNCKFIFEKDLALNQDILQQKVTELYKEDYFKKVDSGWKIRGDGFFDVIKRIASIYRFLKNKKEITVLDYGGGNGYLASRLSKKYNVLYYDKYEKPDISGKYRIVDRLEKADIVCAVELVEHITNIDSWDFLKKLTPDIFVFTTGLSDNIRNKELANWSYLNPDAGHTALYSTRSLFLLAKKYGFIYFFFPNISCHLFVRNKLFNKVNIVALEYFAYSIIRNIIR